MSRPRDASRRSLLLGAMGGVGASLSALWPRTSKARTSGIGRFHVEEQPEGLVFSDASGSRPFALQPSGDLIVERGHVEIRG